MSRETILVTGAAGSVGSTAHAAIATLLEQGHHVRGMMRKLDARADTLRDMGAEVVVADMLDIIACARPCKAAQSCISRCRFRPPTWRQPPTSQSPPEALA